MTSKFFIITILIVALLPGSAMAAGPSQDLIISELQTGLYNSQTGDQAQAEFVELTNSSPADLRLDSNWHLDYLSAANDGTKQATSSLVGLAGTVPAGSHILASFDGYLSDSADLLFGVGSNSASGLLAKSGGHVRLMNGQTMVDCIAWGSAVSIDGCLKVSGSPPDGSSIQRLLQPDHIYGPAGYQALPSPQGQDGFEPESADSPSADDGAAGCALAVIDELMANPAGSDTGREFVELYNPSLQTISLQGCGLQVDSKSYIFTDHDHLLAGQYAAFYSDQTGLVLTNGGGSIQLLGAIQPAVAYPELGDSQVWVQINGSWQISNQPTPNLANLAVDPAIDTLTGTKLVSLTSCPAGKERNPQTGRCRNVPVAATAKACAANQVRDSQTGRCKKVAATSGPKACAAGQERNPQTGRCRKIVPKTAKLKLKDDPAASKTKPSYLIMLTVGILIVAYGIYEYRRELSGWARAGKQWLLRSQTNQE
jgi:hypothetical protein